MYLIATSHSFVLFNSSCNAGRWGNSSRIPLIHLEHPFLRKH